MKPQAPPRSPAASESSERSAVSHQPITGVDADTDHTPVDQASPAGGGPLRVAILGGGPAGSTLAALLADRGVDVVLFDDGKRPDLVVGESLIPAVIPIFRRLGIEDRVAAFSRVKPGVSFLLTDHDHPLHLNFKPVGNRLPQYAYNVPRPALDDLLRQRAGESGVTLAPFRGRVERDPERPDAVRLTQDTLAAVPGPDQRPPDLIVDCTGRRRTIARLLDLPTTDGDRADLAHFAHYQGFDMSGLGEGQVTTGILKEGWSWCIPLPDRVSLGVVLNREQMKKYGDTPEAQLQGVIDADPHLGPRSADATRVSDVVSYTNYQKITGRGHGANWVLLGDAFGFVDPMFSPGLFLAMRSAELLTDQIAKLCPDGAVQRRANAASPVARPRFQKALNRYDREMQTWFRSWMDLIELIYTGNILALREAGLAWGQDHPGRINDWITAHMEKQMACMAAGEATCSRYAWALLRFGVKYGIRGQNPGKYRIK